MYRRFVGSSQTSNALDCARRLRFIGLIVDLNVPGLCEPRSPFPGNGILRAEIKAPKQRLDSETPSTETKRVREPAHWRLFERRREISESRA